MMCCTCRLNKFLAATTMPTVPRATGGLVRSTGPFLGVRKGGQGWVYWIERSLINGKASEMNNLSWITLICFKVVGKIENIFLKWWFL